MVDMAAGHVHTLRVVDVHGGALECRGAPAIDSTGGLWLAHENIYHLTNTGLDPGFHAWSETCWMPTAVCDRLCTPAGRRVVRTLLLTRCRFGQIAAALLTSDLWYLVLSKIRMWELGQRW